VTEDGRIRREAAAPQSIADDDDRSTPRDAVLFGQKAASELQFDGERPEEVIADERDEPDAGEI